MIPGYATPEGTRGYFEKIGVPYHTAPMFSTSPIAIGTHLGEMDETDSLLYQEAISHGLQNGINFIDTAINYRGMRSERDVGFVLDKLIREDRTLKRDEVVISTKAGIIPGDIMEGLVPTEYLKQILLKNNIISESDLHIVDHHRHVLTPSYYRFAMEESRKHLNLTTIDIYYIHNPEISMMVLGAEHFYRQLEKLFTFMEKQVQLGKIQYYGLATWTAFLADPDESGYISLEKVVETARSAAGDDHHFKFIQFPLNSQMDAGVKRKNQRVGREWKTVIDAAAELGVYTTTSAPFHLGKIIGEKDSPQHALEEVVRTPGILSTMVGMKRTAHVKENINNIITG